MAAKTRPAQLAPATRRFVAFLVILVAIVAYVTWQWGNFTSPAQQPPAVPVSAPRTAAAEPGAAKSVAPAAAPSKPRPAAAALDPFARARLDRQQSESQQVDLLQSLADDAQEPSSVRTAAGDKLVALAGRLGKQARAEDLLRAQGYADALVLLDPSGATAIVRAKSLSLADVVRIAAAVARTTGVAAHDVDVLAEE